MKIAIWLKITVKILLGPQEGQKIEIKKRSNELYFYSNDEN